MNKIILPVALMLSYCFWSQAANAEAPIKGWIIQQRSATEGDTTILVCDKGARISWHNIPFYCVCSAPNFQSSIVNPERKVAMTMAPSDWKSMAPHISSDSVNFGSTSTLPEFWCGKPALRFRCKITSSDPYSSRMEQVFRDAHDRSASIDNCELLYSNWIKLSPGLVSFFEGYYRYPRLKMLPIEYVQHYSNGRTITLLKTSTVKEVMIKPEELRVPRGIKATHDRDTVMEEDKKQQRMDGVMEGFFGFEKHTGK